MSGRNCPFPASHPARRGDEALNMRQAPVCSPRTSARLVLTIATRPTRDCGGTSSALIEYGGPNLGEMVLDALRVLPVPLGSRLDTERPEQVGCGRAGVAGLTKGGVQALPGKMMEHQVDDAPRVVG